MYTRRSYQCPQCRGVEEQTEQLRNPSMEGLLHCTYCGTQMKRYFGTEVPIVNYGRPSRSLGGDDQQIAEFQFKHL